MALLFAVLMSPFGAFARDAFQSERAGTGRASSSRPLRVLFIGNSYTYFNNLPRILEQLAASRGTTRHLETKMITVGGATLQDHWEKGDALKAIREGSWNYVVLQEQSALGVTFLVNGQGSVTGPQLFHRYARLFDREIKKSGAKPIFYLTWARKDAQERDQAALNYAYMTIAREMGDAVAPVGIVWQEVRRVNPRPELYIQDNSHPTGAGSYVAACSLYATLFGESPVGLARNIKGHPVNEDGDVDTAAEATLVNLDAADAALIQRLAWQTYQRLKASGGYLTARQPPLPALPTLPAGHKPTDKELEGVWMGELKFYPTPKPAKMELSLRRENGAWLASLKINFGGDPANDKTPQVAEFRVTETGISFTDLKGASGASMKYRASFDGARLSGVTELKSEDKQLYAIGTWELRRQD